MKKEMTMKEKRFSFFADQQKANKECPCSFAHLAACMRTKSTQEGSQKSKLADDIFVFKIKT